MNKEISNKKILVIVPHQDDEINIAGGFIYTYKNDNDIYVAYTTNGDYLYPAKIRYKEAIKSLKVLGIKKDKIFFLGYSDQPYDQNNHMYNTDSIWTSHNNINKTYGTKKISEYNYIKYNEHCDFKKENLVNNLYDLIMDINPDIIICVDLDFHPDHIMTSLCFEKAMGKLLLNNKEYNPIVLKTFAYENSYCGKNDFNRINDKGMIFDVVENKLKNNPYYSIGEELICSIDKRCYSKLLINNPMWKAINKHKSQLFVGHAFQIMNSNFIYWQRNTKNLMKYAKVSASSSNPEFLYDFMLCDSSNILHGDIQNINYDKRIWIPDQNDDKKEINIEFDEQKNIETIKIYNGRINNKFIKNIIISLDNVGKKYKLNNELINEIKINKNVKKITIKVLDDNLENGFSEIEILQNNNNNDNSFKKAIIDDIYTNNFFEYSNNYVEHAIKIYSYLENNPEFSVDTSNLKRGTYTDKKLLISKKTTGYISVHSKDYCDLIHINKNRTINKVLIHFNNLVYQYKVLETRIYRKLFLKKRK